MSTIPKERLEQLASGNAWYCVQDDEAAELARIALASLEADPVAYIFKHPAGKLFWALTDESNKDQSDVIPVYAAPPVPVVPAALPENDDEDGHDIDYLEPSEVYSLGRTAGWNACRAAMLHSAEPVSQAYKLNQLSGNSPVTQDSWISCSDRMPEDTKMLLAFSQGEIVAAYWNWVVNPIDYKKYRAFTYLSGNILDDVTHWMPLPEPPL
ncbi:DUF551 domain-containing protein [Escherichia coli]|uniref:DUF551 domain-containing protein n=1 Tax=Escherichia coli TaxID=562 RepID=UPI0025427E73|nr:DUF551 domain-containing protein [Escherichia coli]MDI4402437.1 DUF551 domain-containing protein [Escherichia coli]